MNKNYPFGELQEKIGSAQKILFVLPQGPNLDQVAAALSLALSFQDAGRTTSIYSPSPMTVEFNRLVGVNQISNKIQGTDLIVSFDYPADQIEKVSYNDDNGRPNIVIQPKVGALPISENLASFTYSGLSADLVFTFGIKNQNQLNLGGQEYGGFLINIDNDPSNSQFGNLNIIESQSTSFSEIVLGIIIGLSMPFGPDMAQNILSGIWKKSQGLTNMDIGADTYEAVAICLRNGAQKPDNRNVKRDENFPPKQKFESREMRRPGFQSQEPPIQPHGGISEEKRKEDRFPDKSKQNSNPPSDWFEPKIFKGSNIA